MVYLRLPSTVTAMGFVIAVPPSLDDLTFESVFDQLAVQAADAPLIVNARETTFATPFGLTALLAVAQSRQVRPHFLPPTDADTLVYWRRNGFFRHAEQLYEMVGRVPPTLIAADSDVLLEVTPITGSGDRTVIAERIQQKTADILIKKLHVGPRAAMRFAMDLAAACCNAARGGWVMVQAYRYKKRLGGRFAVVIAVCDAGRLFGSERSPILGAIRGFVCRHGGKLSVRRSTTRIACVPSWDDDLPRREGLARFPGCQLQIILPEQVYVEG